MIFDVSLDSNTFWTWQDAKYYAKLAFTAWDYTDDNDTDVYSKNIVFDELFCLPPAKFSNVSNNFIR